MAGIYSAAFLLNLGMAAYHYLVIQELSASLGYYALHPFFPLIFSLANVFFGLGAGTTYYRAGGTGWGRCGRRYLLAIGLCIEFSLFALLRMDIHQRLWVSGMTTFVTVATVFSILGRAIGLLYRQTARHTRDRIGALTFCALAGYAVGYLMAARLNVWIGCNACISALGFAFLLAASGAKTRIQLWGILCLAGGLRILPVDAFLEGRRSACFFNLQPNEVYAVRTGKSAPVFEGWSHMGRFAVYRLHDEKHLFGVYNYFRVWDTYPQGAHPITTILESLEPQKTLVIGLGAGRKLADLPERFYRGITGVEINSAVKRFFLYHPEGNDGFFRKIRVLSRDGRTVLDETAEKYDVIVLDGPTTGTRLASSLLTLDGYLTTGEAMKRAIEILSPAGVFVSIGPLRLAGAIAGALQEGGAFIEVFRQKGPRRTGYALQGGAMIPHQWDIGAMVIASRDRDSLKRIDAVFEPAAWEKISPLYFLDPYSDDLPMSMDFARAWLYSRAPELCAQNVFLEQPFTRFSFGRLRGLFYAALLLVLPAIAMAVARIARIRDEVRGQTHPCYFCSIGAGFAVLQLFLLSKFRAFFGDPFHTAFAVNTIFLAFAGVGSLAANRLRVWFSTRSRLLIPASAVFACTYLLGVHIPFQVRHLAGKIFVGILVAAPVSFMAGMFFPLGLLMTPAQRFGQMFLLDGVWAFLGSVLFVLTASTLGVSYNFLWVALFYLAAIADFPCEKQGRGAATRERASLSRAG